MSIKLKILSEDNTPKNCTRRVVLEHDDGFKDWVRDAWDHTFLLWSNSRGHRGDTFFDRNLKKRVEADSPFDPVLDEDGWETDDVTPKPGLIIFPVDIYEHSGRVWFLRGEAPVACRCQFDSTCGNREAPFYLYCDKERWEKYCGNHPWEFADGKPSDALLEKAREVARSEVNEMNLCESDSYYGYNTEKKITERAEVTVMDEHEHKAHVEHHETELWYDDDVGSSCWGYLTDKPARDVDFPLGCPVVSTDSYLVGETFEQECWALRDTESGKFVRLYDKSDKLVADQKYASLMCKQFLTDNREHYEKELGLKLEVVDVTEAVWKEFPECHAEQK